MKKVLFTTAVMALVFSLGFVIPGQEARGASEDTVTLGMLGSFTGPLGPNGVVSRNGALLAKKHINETGFVVGGKKYKLDFYEWDDRTDPKIAVAGVQKLLDDKNIKMIIGPMYSASTLACQPITQPRKVIHITFSSALQVLRPGITFTFRATNDLYWRCTGEVNYLRTMGIETMVFIVENNATALSGYNAASQAFEKLGGKILGKEVFETGATDFFTPLTRLKNMNADALFICSNPEPAGLIIKQTKEIGWPVQTIAEGNPPTGPAFWEIGGKAIEGHLDLTAVPGLDPGPKLTKLIGFDPALRKKFWDGFQAEYKMDPNLVTAQYYYDYTHLAVEAMKAAASIDDTEKIRQALLDMEWKGVYEKWTFYPNGQCWNFTTVSVIHAGKGWTGMAFIEPGDREFKTFKIHELMPTPKIKDIRKQRGY